VNVGKGGNALSDRPSRAASGARRPAVARAVGAALIAIVPSLAGASPVKASSSQRWEPHRCASVLAVSGSQLEQEVARRDDPAHDRVTLGIALKPGIPPTPHRKVARGRLAACAFVDANRNGQLDRGEPSKVLEREVALKRGLDGQGHLAFQLRLRVKDPALQRVCEKSSIRLAAHERQTVQASELSCTPIEPPPVVPEVSRAALLPATALVLIGGLVILRLRGRRGATGVG
jgi:hypothetical protein